MKQTTTLGLLALILCTYVHAQTPALQRVIYFEPGKAAVHSSILASLQRYYDSVKLDNSVHVFIAGHADSGGGYEQNMLLSKERALYIKECLVKSGIADSLISVEYFGTDKPVASNATTEGRNKNRRVEVSISIEARPVEGDASVVKMNELLAAMASPVQEFTVSRLKDTVIKCSNGTIIGMKANSLIPLPGSDSDKVVLKVKEDVTIGDMLLDNLSTTSDGKILETSGMIYMEAFDSKGNRLELQRGKGLEIAMPADSLKLDVQLFNGTVNAHSHALNWVPDKESVPVGVSWPACLGCIREYRMDTVLISPAPFLWRVARMRNVMIGTFSKEMRMKNIYYRKNARDRRIRYRQNIKDTFWVEMPPAENSKDPRCKELLSLYQKYRVYKDTALIKAMNFAFMKKYNVWTIEELSYKLVLLKIIEQANVFGQGRSYNFFTTGVLGWRNLDSYERSAQMIKQYVNVKANGDNSYCKILFRNRGVILNANVVNGYFVFGQVLKNEKAVIVVIKNENNQHYLGIKEIVTGRKPVDIDFKNVSVDELKAELKKLN
ncbi:OmpA family protein [Filimonas lacunae]|uniref:OmpA family protein n=1 Tax=Filimonas lacunae TaxID=477680 RepID=A0A173MIH2_9BACT|nr:OmpA family protein [Filimonas lacunae]BAV07267.1 outer membrane protein [Filimonas lacunae]SIS92281.1 OmpA family protein [Filimonas lacunae]